MGKASSAKKVARVARTSGGTGAGRERFRLGYGAGIALLIVVGVVLAVTWQPVVGSGLASLGFVYVALGLRRATRWRAWRRAVGLDGGGRDTLQP